MRDTFNVVLDTTSTDRAFKRLKEGARPAIARALNRSAGSAKTAMVRVIAADLGLKAGDVRDHVVVKEARPDNLTATFFASGKRLPLIDFRARGPEPSRGKGRGVSARLPGGAGRYPNAFIATMGSGHRGVFVRRPGSGRLPITELHGPSIAQSFRKNVSIGAARAKEQLIKNIQSELRFAMSKPTS